MNVDLDELSKKDIINVEDGSRVGYVRDVLICAESGNVVSLIAETAAAKINPFKKTDTICICWNDIVVIGKETILIKKIDLNESTGAKKRKISDIFDG